MVNAVAREKRIISIVNSITVIWLSFRFGFPNAEHVLSNASFISIKDARFEKESENKRKIEFIVNTTVSFTKAHLMCEE